MKSDSVCVKLMYMSLLWRNVVPDGGAGTRVDYFDVYPVELPSIASEDNNLIDLKRFISLKVIAEFALIFSCLSSYGFIDI